MVTERLTGKGNRRDDDREDDEKDRTRVGRSARTPVGEVGVGRVVIWVAELVAHDVSFGLVHVTYVG